MHYFSKLGGFEYHEQVVSGSFEYYIYVHADGRILIMRLNPVTLSVRYSFSPGTPTFAQVVADPAALTYKVISEWKIN